MYVEIFFILRRPAHLPIHSDATRIRTHPVRSPDEKGPVRPTSCPAGTRTRHELDGAPPASGFSRGGHTALGGLFATHTPHSNSTTAFQALAHTTCHRLGVALSLSLTA